MEIELLLKDKLNSYCLFYRQNYIAPEILRELKKYSNATFIASTSRHYSISEQTAFLGLLNKENCDLMHFPNFNVPIFYKKPYVVTIHDMVHHKISGAKKSRYFHFLAYKKVIEKAAKNARAIITVSESSKKDIVKHLNVLPRKVEVIYEASSLNANVSEKQVLAVKKRYFLDKPYFLFVGVLERKKNVVNLTRGFDIFLQSFGLDMDLVIVGKSDPHYPLIKKSAMDIANKNRLVFVTSPEDEELSALYKGAYAFVSASLHEGFGLPGVEAMNFGLPLGVSNTEVFNEIYDNAAVYFNPLEPGDIAEKMHLLAKDPNFYQSLSEKSFKRSQSFSWRETAKKTLEVYNQILNK
jgi:glycosyltransferase involved in cell wall biosynthesis